MYLTLVNQSISKADDKLLEEFQCNLLSINPPCAFLDILIPPIKIIDHDKTYAASQHTENVHAYNSSITTPTIIHNIREDDECSHAFKDERMALECLIAKLSLNVTSEERLKLERVSFQSHNGTVCVASV